MNHSKVQLRDLHVHYDDNPALTGVSMALPDRQVTALIGPSGCGKSTLLRALNRMHDEVPSARVFGKVLLDGENIYDKHIDPVEVRRRVGMVFQKANPFPKSIRDNIAFGLRIKGVKKGSVLDERIESALRRAALWEEVRDRLDTSALDLSGGQQQRLCIARALAVDPEVLLMDEPASALDPIATAKIEALIRELKREHCIVIVTHSLQQARRLSDHTAFLYLGDLVEHRPTAELFEAPEEQRTRDYVKGRFG